MQWLFSSQWFENSHFVCLLSLADWAPQQPKWQIVQFFLKQGWSFQMIGFQFARGSLRLFGGTHHWLQIVWGHSLAAIFAFLPTTVAASFFPTRSLHLLLQLSNHLPTMSLLANRYLFCTAVIFYYLWLTWLTFPFLNQNATNETLIATLQPPKNASCCHPYLIYTAAIFKYLFVEAWVWKYIFKKISVWLNSYYLCQ